MLNLILQSLPRPTIDLTFPGAEVLIEGLSWLLGGCALVALGAFLLSAAKRAGSAVTGGYGKRAEANSGMAGSLLAGLLLGAGWYFVTFAIQTGQGIGA